MELLELLNETLKPFDVTVSDGEWEKFEKYMRLLQEWNEKMNLTAITDDEGIVVKHFADSLTALPTVKSLGGKSLADVGTGAGFPAIPLKIMCPELKVYLVDSLEKRLKFLQTVIDNLGLTGIETVHLRAEDAGRDVKLRDNVDVVTARAVAAMPVLLEYCMPLVKPGGHFVALKGTKDDGSFKHAEAELSAKLISKNSFNLVVNDETAGRNIFVFEKTAPTKKQYPRKAGTPSSKPL